MPLITTVSKELLGKNQWEKDVACFSNWELELRSCLGLGDRGLSDICQCSYHAYSYCIHWLRRKGFPKEEGFETLPKDV